MTTKLDPQAFNDAAEFLTAQLKAWGLEGLSTDARGMLENGDSVDVIPLKLRNTDAYKKRFSANDERLAKGLPALSEAEYVATERQYQSTLREYGLPQGFYDDHSDFNNWLANDVSPQELNDRAQTARAAYLDASPQVRDQWEKLYGLTPSDAVATFLDESKALDILKRKAQAATIGAEAFKAYQGNYQITADRAEELTNAGVTQQQAQAGYQDVASRLGHDQFLGRMAGENFTQTEAENEVLMNNTSAKAERDKIYSAEQGRFKQNYMGTTQAGLASDTGGKF